MRWAVIAVVLACVAGCGEDTVVGIDLELHYDPMRCGMCQRQQLDTSGGGRIGVLVFNEEDPEVYNETRCFDFGDDEMPDVGALPVVLNDRRDDLTFDIPENTPLHVEFRLWSLPAVPPGGDCIFDEDPRRWLLEGRTVAPVEGSEPEPIEIDLLCPPPPEGGPNCPP